MTHIVLFLHADSLSPDRLALDEETRAIQQELERSRLRDAFEFVSRSVRNPLDLLRELRTLRPTMVHFWGRRGVPGRESRGVFLQCADGRSQLASTAALQDIFGAAGSSVKLVVLSGCYAESQAEALLAHVDCVVGIGESIADEVVQTFAIGFYSALAAHESVATAYHHGCAAISLDGLCGDARPRLRVRTGVDADTLTLAAMPPPRSLAISALPGAVSIQHLMNPGPTDGFRDIGFEPAAFDDDVAGRRLVAVIGIDRYQSWPHLSNAVNDARGALDAFVRSGFEPLGEPLIDKAATMVAIRALVTDELARLSEDDSLVLFFAGHGYTTTRTFRDGDSVKTGFLIPVDGDVPGGSQARWIRLDTWLSDLARIPAKHLLVFLDACHTGIALGSLLKTRDWGRPTESFARLARRRSRRVITSAQDDQRAMDSGPIRNHSLFTGCLIEALDGGMASHGELVTGSQIGLHLQQRITAYPASSQTPDFGSLEEDKRGELMVRIITREGAETKARQGTTASGRNATTAKAPDQAVVETLEAAPVPSSDQATIATAWNQRELCPNGACNSVMGADSTCKVCGHAAEQATIATTWDQRELCPDGACNGLMGADGTCSVCGLAAVDLGFETAKQRRTAAGARQKRTRPLRDSGEEQHVVEDHRPVALKTSKWVVRKALAGSAALGLLAWYITYLILCTSHVPVDSAAAVGLLPGLGIMLLAFYFLRRYFGTLSD